MARKKQTKKQKARAAAKKKRDSMTAKISGIVNKVASPVAFWTQLTSKDYQILNADPDYRNLPNLEKAKVAVNILTGSVTGKVFFPHHYNPSANGEPRINPAGVINKTVGIGGMGLLYGAVGKQFKLPQYANINRIAKKVIYGGAVGGFFDPPSANPHQQSSKSYSTAHVTPVTTQNRSVTRNSAMQTYDLSTQGAFR
jgi:hypothetical protein